MPEIPQPMQAEPSTVAWNKVHGYCDKLFDALESLDEAGGSAKAAVVGNWSDKAGRKALEVLKATREALDGEIGRLEARLRHRAAQGKVG